MGHSYQNNVFMAIIFNNMKLFKPLFELFSTKSFDPPKNIIASFLARLFISADVIFIKIQ